MPIVPDSFLEGSAPQFESSQPRPIQEKERTPVQTRSALPALTYFNFRGVCEYLEDLIAGIDAPFLDKLKITFFHQLIFDTPQLAQFIRPSLLLLRLLWRAIWSPSRCPTNPSSAPGIIISPRSRPPQDVLEKALRVSTPLESPKPAVVDLPAIPPCVIAVTPPDLLPTQTTPDGLQKLASESDPAESPHNDLPEAVSSTETEVSTVSNTPPVPTSPLSSSTSVSTADTAHSQAKSLSESCEQAVGIVASIVTQESTPVEVPEPPPALPSSSLNTTVPMPPEAVSSSAVPTFSPTSASTSTPTPASAPPVLKKSWASLLHPAAGEAGSTSKSSLPTSSNVGFSIPASPPPPLVPPVRWAELIALSVTLPGASSTIGCKAVEDSDDMWDFGSNADENGDDGEQEES
ncbi:hypothetical protein V8E52_010101 [Russula decolorans]